MATPRIRAMPASRRAVRPEGQARRPRRASGISRTALTSRDRSAIPPMPAAFMGCGRRLAASRPSMFRCRRARSGRRLPAVPNRAALCLERDALETVAEVKAAVADAGKRLERAGWVVEEVEAPPMREAAELQTKLWLGDGYEAQLEAAEREGDPGALACLRGNKTKVFPFDAA